MKFNSYEEAQRAFEADRAKWLELGIVCAMDGAVAYLPESFGTNVQLAFDAQPTMVTSPNAGVPSFLFSFINPEVYSAVIAPNAATEILSEQQQGDWTTKVGYFPIVEYTGEVVAYGDHQNGGQSNANADLPTRQSFLFQTHLEYGDLEVESMAKARLNWIGEKQEAVARQMNKFMNLSYHVGVANIECWGLMNDPTIAVNATLTPGVKAAGNSNKWLNGTTLTATANEILVDIASLYQALNNQSGGIITQKDELILVLASTLSGGLNATTTYNVNVQDMLSKNYPNLRVVLDPLFASANGLTSGNLIQLIAPRVAGQKFGLLGYNERMRMHPLVRERSAAVQKVTGGTFGAVVRQGFACAQMLGC